MTETMGKAKSLTLVGIAYVVAIAVRAAWLLWGVHIPMMETRSLERRPSYQDVIDRVSRFVPRPPRRA